MTGLLRIEPVPPGQQQSTARPRPTATKGGQLPSSYIKWEDQQQRVLETLTTALTSPPILAYPDFSRDFVVHTDASKDGLWAVLYKEDNDHTLRVISYGSQFLTQAEKIIIYMLVNLN